MKNSVKYVVWDWNGTLFNDVEICINCMNQVLINHELPIIKSKEEYRSKFCFPVQKYYENIGFNIQKIPFKQLAKEFIEIYQPNSVRYQFEDEIEALLLKIQNMGIFQIILSASNLDNLLAQVDSFGVSKYFINILGVDNIYAKTKIDIAYRWIKNYKIDSSEIMIIGDTIHDYEVSKEIGCQCVIYNNGHEDIYNKDIGRSIIINKLGEVLRILGEDS